MNPHPYLPYRPSGQTADPRLNSWTGQVNPGNAAPLNTAGTGPATTPATTPSGPAPNTQNPGGSPPPNTWGPQTYGFDPRTMAGRTVTPDLAWYFGQDSVGRTIGNDGTAMATFSAPADGLGGRVPRDNRIASTVTQPTTPASGVPTLTTPQTYDPMGNRSGTTYDSFGPRPTNDPSYRSPSANTIPDNPLVSGSSARQVTGQSTNSPVTSTPVSSAETMVNPSATVAGGNTINTPIATSPGIRRRQGKHRECDASPV